MASSKISLSEHFTIKKILKFALPSILMMIFSSIYTIVDGFFVSNFAGEFPFAGLNFVFPYLSVITAFGFMFGAGGSALIGKYLGEENNEKANSVFSMINLYCIILGIILIGVGELTLKPIAILLGAEGDLLKYALEYGRVYLIGTPFFMLQYMYQPLFVVSGKPKEGFLVIVVAGVTNMILDLLLVAILDLKVIGAAIATVTSVMVGGIVPIIYFIRKNKSNLRLGKPNLNIKDFSKVCTNGISEYVGEIAFSVVGILYNYQLLKYLGADGVSAYGVLLYVGFIFVAIFIGYNTSISQITSYHFGAQNKKELKSLLSKSLIIITIFGVSMLILSESLASVIAKIFVGYNESLYTLTIHAFRIYAIHFIFCGYSIYISGMFTALNDGITSAIISFVRTLIFEVLFVLILPKYYGADAIWWSVTLSELVSFILAFLCLFIRRKKFGYMDK
ncbi:MAG: MATE family efflux transporter [Gammaproteobacteria bacterium]|nr:MATE family efflux transporter [Gammaproteobacteria bacterium]